jgi:arylsulfatase A
MDRRKFMGTAAAGAAGLVLTGARATLARGKKPNIIIIMADDLGYGDLGCYGSEGIATPNLDRIADEGARLTSFFSSGPVCSPSRAGLLTGRYPARVGVTGVYFPSRNPTTPLIHGVTSLGPGMNTRELTLAQRLKTAGYRTCCIGKWHLGDMKQYRPNHRGFDHYMGLLYSNDMTPLPLYRNDEIIEKSPVDQNYLTRNYTKEAIQWIDENHDKPFLLYLPHTFPHIPLHASPEFRGSSSAGLYGDCVEELDWSVGEVLKALDKYGIAEDTFIFFTSDNGPWYQGSPGGFRGRKGQTFDGGMRVPGIARWPAMIPAGKTSDEMSMNIDLFATSLAIAGVEIPEDRTIDGKNILPMLRGDETPHEALFFYKGKSLQAVRADTWKYRRRHMGWGAGVEYAFISKGPMLFNLETDPNESYNVIDLYPEKARELAKLMDDWEAGFVKGVPR